MRVSTKESDPGFIEYAYNYEVVFNGEKIANCFTADEERGLVWIFEEDSGGNFIRDGDERLKEKMMKGRVEIIKPFKE